MRPSLAAVACLVLLLPSVTPALFDEPSPRKVKLEDIEEEHLQHERRTKTGHHSPFIPPSHSKQPAKGQPMKLYTPLTIDDAAAEYQKQAPTSAHHQYTSARANHQHQRVQPLTDQPTAPEAGLFMFDMPPLSSLIFPTNLDYQPSPAYQSETIVYLPSRARAPGNGDQQTPQQPSPIFYYSHDTRQSPSTGNGYNSVQFVPISQSSGSDEHQPQHHQQSSYRGPQVTVPSAEASASAVSYTHTSAGSSQPSPAVQYVTSNDVREPSELQHVYSLFESHKDIEYVKPEATYGAPAQQPSPTYGPSQQSTPGFGSQKDIEYAQGEGGRKPAITYGPSSGFGETPKIQYGDPDAPFRRPLSQSHQNAYAPHRPESESPQPNEKPFAVSFPYPPSFVSITTSRPYYEKAPATPEPAYNEVSQWQAPNVMPLHLIPPQDTEYRSYSSHVAPTPSPATAEAQSTPLIDFFQSRRAKSLLDSYIPSWLIARMQEEHARHFQQQSYAQPQAGYNTIAYSTHFGSVYPKNFKRSIKRSLPTKTV